MSPWDQLIAELPLLWVVLSNTWWLWLPVVLFFVARDYWALYLKSRYFVNLEWVLFEIRIPQEVVKTPEAMEHVFAGLQTFFFEFDPLEKWWQGLQHDYLSFEMTGIGGEIHFYVRTPKFFRNVVESLIYAQYPEAEITEETQDYMKLLPDEVPSENWDLFGVEFKLAKEDAYPVRTYRDIMSLAPGQKEAEKVDPFSAIAEIFSKLKPGEYMGYHLLLRPAQTPETNPNAWKEAGEALVAKLIGKKIAPKKTKLEEAVEPLKPFITGWGEPLREVFGVPAASPPAKEEKQEGESMMLHLSPGAREVVAAIERKILKPGFETIIRFCYVARRDMFHLSHLSGFIGAIKQFNTLTMNGFGFNGRAFATKTPWWWPEFLKKRLKAYKIPTFYHYFRVRKPFTDLYFWLHSKFSVLNSEELASIFHFPGTTSRAPLMPRLEAKRAEPPAALPTG